jgi:hypothetical protein
VEHDSAPPTGGPLPDEGGVPRRGRAHKWLIWSAVVIVVGLVFGGGWGAALAFVSPQQRAATAAAPRPDPITATVTRGTLSQTISAQATVEQATQSTIPLPASTGLAVVTSVSARAAGVIGNGQTVLSIDGEPIIALEGAFPFYRDLSPGTTGPDVTQLQTALKAAGYAIRVTGTYDVQTARSVTALRRKTGQDATDTSISAGELLVIPSASVTVVSLPSVGDIVTGGSSIVVASGSTVAAAQVAPALSVSLKAGTTCEVTASDGSDIAGKVASFTPPAKDGDNASVVIIPDKGTFPSTWLSTSVVAVFELKKVAGESLIVPSAAIVTSGNDRTYVLVQQPGGRFLEVPVTEVAELNGMSAVKSVGDGKLSEGDLIRVG